MWVFVHVGIHNISRKFHLSKLDFTQIKTNNIRMKTMTVRSNPIFAGVQLPSS